MKPSIIDGIQRRPEQVEIPVQVIPTLSLAETEEPAMPEQMDFFEFMPMAEPMFFEPALTFEEPVYFEDSIQPNVPMVYKKSPRRSVWSRVKNFMNQEIISKRRMRMLYRGIPSRTAPTWAAKAAYIIIIGASALAMAATIFATAHANRSTSNTGTTSLPKTVVTEVGTTIDVPAPTQPTQKVNSPIKVQSSQTTKITPSKPSSIAVTVQSPVETGITNPPVVIPPIVVEPPVVVVPPVVTTFTVRITSLFGAQVYSATSTTSSILANLMYGTTLTVDETIGTKWYHVSYRSANGTIKTGYILQSAVTK